jgi:hypothetical protein
LLFKEPGIGVARGQEAIGLNIDDYIDYHLLSIMADPKKRFDYVSIHEMVHVEQRL